MKPSFKNMAKFYNKSYQTISRMKKDNRRVYDALKDYFMKKNPTTEKER